MENNSPIFQKNLEDERKKYLMENNGNYVELKLPNYVKDILIEVTKRFIESQC